MYFARISMLMLLALLLGAAFSGVSAAEPRQLPAAAKAPYPSMGLKELREMVAASRGKVVLINVFASWCGPCREEMPVLIGMRKEFSEDRLVMAGVSVDDDVSALQRYAAGVGFSFPIYLGQEDFVRWAGISAVPHTLIYDKTGKLLVSGAGMLDEETLRAFLAEQTGGKR